MRGVLRLRRLRRFRLRRLRLGLFSSQMRLLRLLRLLLLRLLLLLLRLLLLVERGLLRRRRGLMRGESAVVSRTSHLRDTHRRRRTRWGHTRRRRPLLHVRRGLGDGRSPRSGGGDGGERARVRHAVHGRSRAPRVGVIEGSHRRGAPDAVRASEHGLALELLASERLALLLHLLGVSPLHVRRLLLLRRHELLHLPFLRRLVIVHRAEVLAHHRARPRARRPRPPVRLAVRMMMHGDVRVVHVVLEVRHGGHRRRLRRLGRVRRRVPVRARRRRRGRGGTRRGRRPGHHRRRRGVRRRVHRRRRHRRVRRLHRGFDGGDGRRRRRRVHGGEVRDGVVLLRVRRRLLVLLLMRVRLRHRRRRGDARPGRDGRRRARR